MLVVRFPLLSGKQEMSYTGAKRWHGLFFVELLRSRRFQFPPKWRCLAKKSTKAAAQHSSAETTKQQQ